MSTKEKSWFAPKILRVSDMQGLRYSLGLPFREMFYLLGFPKILERSKAGSEHEEGPVISPPLGILIRMLWAHPEDNPYPPEPDFQEIRRLLTTATDKRGRDNLAAQGWLSVLLGFRKNNGNEWVNGNVPTPVTRRTFLLLQYIADRYGADEAMRRLQEAAEQEAQARGTTTEEIYQNGSWPRTPEEKISGGSRDNPNRYTRGRKKIEKPKNPKGDGQANEPDSLGD